MLNNLALQSVWFYVDGDVDDPICYGRFHRDYFLTVKGAGEDGTRYVLFYWGGAYQAALQTGNGWEFIGKPTWLKDAKAHAQANYDARCLERALSASVAAGMQFDPSDKDRIRMMDLI